MPKLLPSQYGKILYKLTEGKKGKELELAINVFADFLRENRVTTKLEFILKEFVHFAKEQEGITEMEIISVEKLSKDILSVITNKFPGKVELTEVTDKSIGGGVIIKTRNTILDGSLNTQLIKLKNHLIN